MGLQVAVLGATGLVGGTMMSVLAERDFPVDRLVPLASERSAGRSVVYQGERLTVGLAEPEAFEGMDLVLASAGGSVSERLLPEAARRGAVCVDNSSAFRMDPEVPLVVPEVNAGRALEHGQRRIVANPNCSTIQLAVALAPLHERFGVRRVRVATYQSASGAGQAGVDELIGDTTRTLLGQPEEPEVFARRIGFNAIPQIDVPMPDGDTREEWKMRVETPKILGAPIEVHATCVRIPAAIAHAEAVWVETESPIPPDRAREILAAAPGIEIADDLEKGEFPTPRDSAGTDAVRIGRIRRDPTVPHGLALWVVADNVRKGAALNAVQIAEVLAEHWRRSGRA